MRAVLQIENAERKAGSGFNYKHGDLYEILKDLAQNAQIGDRVTIQFEFDEINHQRANNFISIMQLYEANKTR